MPLKLFAERGIFDKRRKIDLVLGDGYVLVEIKCEPDYPGVSKPVVFSTKTEAAGAGSVEDDLEKIEQYAKNGKIGHFIMIDEDGRHERKIKGPWRSLKGKRRAFLLHISAYPLKS